MTPGLSLAALLHGMRLAARPYRWICLPTRNRTERAPADEPGVESPMARKAPRSPGRRHENGAQEISEAGRPCRGRACRVEHLDDDANVGRDRGIDPASAELDAERHDAAHDPQRRALYARDQDRQGNPRYRDCCESTEKPGARDDGRFA